MTCDEQTSNRYSPLWFDFFHVGIDEARTNREVEFIGHCVPRSEFPTILDVCCGMGRHARALSKHGYNVTGIDRDPKAISKARELGSGPNYLGADIRDYQFPSEFFDAAIVMGQSFGHFDVGTNRDVLRRLAINIRNGGRIILDLWNPAFFMAHQGTRELKTARGNVRETKRVDSDRLFVQLEYPDGTQEKFEWQLFTAEQMTRLADSVTLILLFSCSGFDRRNDASPTDPRLQCVLEKR